jgi:hypothetical protein
MQAAVVQRVCGALQCYDVHDPVVLPKGWGSEQQS